MAEEEKPEEEQSDVKEEKAKLDDEDILAELGLTEDKAELDSEGILDQEDTGIDKAILDSEGILDEPPEPLAIQEETKPPTDAKHPAAEKTAPPPDKETVNLLQVLLDKVKSFPVIKISVIAGGTLLLFFIGWICIALFFSPAGEEKVVTEKVIKEIIEEEPVAEDRIVDGISNLVLEPFMVPVHDSENETVFLKISVRLRLEFTERQIILQQLKSIRAAVFQVLSAKHSDDFKKKKKIEIVRKELQNTINNALRKTIVKNVSLSNIILI